MPLKSALGQTDDDADALPLPVGFEAGGPAKPREVDPARRGFLGLGLPSGYRIAPIGWRGVIADEFNQQTSTDSVNRSHRQTLSLYANTFVLHPAVLSLNGNINWSTGTTGVKGGIDTRDTSATGGLSASALSRTNYPLTLSYDVSDSAIDGIQARSRFRRHAWRYFQSYRPPGGSYSANGSAGKARTTGSDGKSSAQDVSFGFNTGFGEGHALSFNSAFSSSSEVTGRDVEDFATYFSHSFSLEDYYRVNNTARYGQSSSTALIQQGAVSPATEYRDAQLFNAVMWIPSDESPLVLNSGLSVDWNERDGAAANSFGGNLSANYPFSEKLSLTASANGSQTQSGATRTRLAATALSLIYNGDNREFGAYRHGWGASTGASAQKSSSGAGTGVSASVSQMLSRAIELENQDTVNLMFVQTLLQTRANSSGQQQSQSRTASFVSHAADVSYGARGAGDDLRGGLRLQDMRQYGDDGDTVVQSISVTADGRKEIDRYSSLVASLGFGLTRSLRTDLAQTAADTGWTQSGSGTLSYRLQQPFRWRLASYEANFRFNLRNDRRLVAGVEVNPYLYAYSLDHALTARVGLLSARLRNDFSWSESGDFVWGLSFRVSRDF